MVIFCAVTTTFNNKFFYHKNNLLP
jgi:hypothetical protein